MNPVLTGILYCCTIRVTVSPLLGQANPLKGMMCMWGAYFLWKKSFWGRILYHCALAGLAWAADADRAVGRSENPLGQVVMW